MMICVTTRSALELSPKAENTRVGMLHGLHCSCSLPAIAREPGGTPPYSLGTPSGISKTLPSAEESGVVIEKHMNNTCSNS